jgi:hypothetical protein
MPPPTAGERLHGLRKLALGALELLKTLIPTVPRIDVEDDDATSSASRDADVCGRPLPPPTLDGLFVCGRVVQAMRCSRMLAGTCALWILATAFSIFIWAV